MESVTVLDDRFRGRNTERPASLTIDELKDIQRQLKESSKKLHLFVTLHTRRLDTMGRGNQGLGVT